MSAVSTGRLIVEGVVENLRIYRLYLQERGRAAEREVGMEKGKRGGRGHGEGSKRGDEEEGRRKRHRHRSEDAGRERRERSHGHGRSHGRRSRDGRGDRDSQGRRDHDQHPDQRRNISAPDAEPPSGTHHQLSGALHAAEILLGPEGTPFGSLPTRGRGVGILPHAKSVYRHIKAEQDAGHRSKGFVESHVGTFLLKRRGGKSAVGSRDGEGERLLGEDRGVGDGSGGRNGSRRARRRSGSRGCKGRRRRQDDLVGEQVRDVEGSPDVRRGSSGLPQSGGSAALQPTPEMRSAPSVRDGQTERGKDSRDISHTPTIRIQSPTPPEPQTPFARGPLPETKSPKSEPGGPARSPHPSHGACTPPPLPTLPVAPPLFPPPPPPAPRSSFDPARGALLASIVGGVKLRNVSEEGKEDNSAARKDESRVEDTLTELPIYDRTPHSRDVEALKHVQSVEEEERNQEREPRSKCYKSQSGVDINDAAELENHRTAIPLPAPQPRVNVPTNFQDELAAKLRGVNLAKQSSKDETEPGLSGEPGILRPCASYETWRTVGSEYEEGYHEPDRAFRESLGNALSAGDSPRPPTGMVDSGRLFWTEPH